MSLNAQSSDAYIQACRPRQPFAYEYMLDFVRKTREKVETVSVSALEGLPGVDVTGCMAIARELDVHYRTRILDQVG